VMHQARVVRRNGLIFTVGSVGLAIAVLAAVGLAGISSGPSVRLASPAHSTPTATALTVGSLALSTATLRGAAPEWGR